MTGQEWGALSAIITSTTGAIGFLIKWAVNSLTKSSDETRQALKESTATVAVNTEVTRKFSTDVRQLFSRLDKQSEQIDGVVEAIDREKTPIHIEKPTNVGIATRRTPPSGIPAIREVNRKPGGEDR